MNKANKHETDNERNDVEMMSDGTLKRLIAWLKAHGHTSDEIVDLLEYISGK